MPLSLLDQPATPLESAAELALGAERLLASVKAESRAWHRTLRRLERAFPPGLQERANWVLPDLLKAHYQVQVAKFRCRSNPTSTGEPRLDLYARGFRDNEPVIVLGELKSRIYDLDVRAFAECVARVRANLDKPLFPLMFGYVVHPLAQEAADELGILVAWPQAVPAWK